MVGAAGALACPSYRGQDKSTTLMPDLVRTDQERGGQYAPIVLATNRDVSTIRSGQAHGDLPHRHCDPGEPLGYRASRPAPVAGDRHTICRAYLRLLIPEVRRMRAEIDA
jgi:hypothetical protein